jgi:hypothetical protein
MGEAFITRRGGADDSRVASGWVTKMSGEKKLSISDIGFTPKQIVLCPYRYIPSYTSTGARLVSLEWRPNKYSLVFFPKNNNGTQIAAGVDSAADGYFTVETTNNGFDITLIGISSVSLSFSVKEYYWTAFEEEQPASMDQ